MHFLDIGNRQTASVCDEIENAVQRVLLISEQLEDKLSRLF